ncbi:hypothetical protein pipiens_010310 [Culex pipiens pipiens]|uniref:Uncharacterized protein n=1 Tax=Culex pipiens pipiens TaxID=38569 RepID=A0ABD1DB04_CULPP
MFRQQQELYSGNKWLWAPGVVCDRVGQVMYTSFSVVQIGIRGQMEQRSRSCPSTSCWIPGICRNQHRLRTQQHRRSWTRHYSQQVRINARHLVSQNARHPCQDHPSRLHHLKASLRRWYRFFVALHDGPSKSAHLLLYCSMDDRIMILKVYYQRHCLRTCSGQVWDTRLGSVKTITFVDDNRRFMTTSDNECLRDIPVDMDTPIQRCTRCPQLLAHTIGHTGASKGGPLLNLDFREDITKRNSLPAPVLAEFNKGAIPEPTALIEGTIPRSEMTHLQVQRSAKCCCSSVCAKLPTFLKLNRATKKILHFADPYFTYGYLSLKTIHSPASSSTDNAASRSRTTSRSSVGRTQPSGQYSEKESSSVQ